MMILVFWGYKNWVQWGCTENAGCWGFWEGREAGNSSKLKIFRPARSILCLKKIFSKKCLGNLCITPISDKFALVTCWFNWVGKAEKEVMQRIPNSARLMPKKTSEGIFQYFCDKKFFQKLNFMKILKFLEKERKVFW